MFRGDLVALDLAQSDVLGGGGGKGHSPLRVSSGADDTETEVTGAEILPQLRRAFA